MAGAAFLPTRSLTTGTAEELWIGVTGYFVRAEDVKATSWLGPRPLTFGVGGCPNHRRDTGFTLENMDGLRPSEHMHPDCLEDEDWMRPKPQPGRWRGMPSGRFSPCRSPSLSESGGFRLLHRRRLFIALAPSGFHRPFGSAMVWKRGGFPGRKGGNWPPLTQQSTTTARRLCCCARNR